MQGTPNDLVRDFAVRKPSSIRVFESFGIDYCCGGEKTLDQACRDAGASIGQVLAALNDGASAPKSNDSNTWSAAPLTDLTAHIAEKHHGYVKSEAPRLQALLEKVALKHGASHPELFEIRELFAAMASELSIHMMKEEQILFPHIQRAETAIGASLAPPAAFFGSVGNPIRRMLEEHDDAGALLKRIRALSKDFAVPGDACASYRAVYRGLEEFEKDLHTHVHLENNILFPRALELERKVQRATQWI